MRSSYNPVSGGRLAHRQGGLMQVILSAAFDELQALVAGVGVDHHWHTVSGAFQVPLSWLQKHQSKIWQHSYLNKIALKGK